MLSFDEAWQEWCENYDGELTPAELFMIGDSVHGDGCSCNECALHNDPEVNGRNHSDAWWASELYEGP